MTKAKKIIGFLLLLSSTLTMMSGAIIAPSLPAISKYFAALPHAEFLTKIILTIPAIVITFTAPFVGSISRKTGKIRLLLLAYLLYGLAGSAGLYLDNLYFILLSRMFFGLSVSVILTITTTLIGDYFTGNQRSRFISMQGSFVSGAGILFITFSGVLADTSWRLPFAIYLFPFIFLLPAIKYFYEPPSDNDNSSQNIQNVKRKLSGFSVYYVYALSFLGMLFFYLIPVHLPFLLVDTLHQNASMTGIAIAIMSISGATISWFYKNIKAYLDFFPIFSIAFLVMGAGFVIVGLAQNIVILITGLVVSGYGLGLLVPNSNLFFIDNAAPGRRTKLLGGLSSAFFLGQFSSPVISEPLFRLTGTQTGFLYFAAATLILSGIVAIKYYKNKARVKPVTTIS